MKKISPLIQSVFAICAITIIGCGGPKGTMQAAREAYSKKEYFVAGENYKAVYTKTKNKTEKNEASFMTAESYRLSNDMKNAENWYRKTTKADPKNHEAQYQLAVALKNNQKFTEAIQEFNVYKNLSGEDARVEQQIRGCELALKWKNEKTRYVVENVKSLNTKWSDFAPSLYKKDVIYFTSDREKGSSNKAYGWTGNSHTDIYRASYKVDKKDPNNIRYMPAELVDKDIINTPYNDGTVAFDSRFNTMYYTQCNGKTGKGNYCRIFQATAQGKAWVDPQPLSFSLDSFNCGHPSLSKDGQTLYFSSDMPGGYGGKDIWYVTYSKRGKTWSEPVNLGPAINTEGDEMFPFMHDDGTLFFASNGHVGLGGVDIFFTKGDATDWSTPINMKSPINSGGDDFAIIFYSGDNERGFFSSNREGGKGQDDIYRFYMTPLVFTLSGVARDIKTKAALPKTQLTITNSSDTVKLIVMTDDKGYYKITLNRSTDYELFGQKEDYYDSKMEFQTTKGLEVSTDLVQDLELDPFDYEAVFTLDGIYYDLDKANIRTDAARILDTIVVLLNKYPKIRLELGSHTDCRSDSIYNKGLSQRRADSAVSYIVRQGIDSLRLVARGYGESELVNDCACEGSYVKRKCNEEEHQMNRRTTFRLLDNNYVPKSKEEMKGATDKQVVPQKGKQPAKPTNTKPPGKR
jgi:peptidoglycan-associated lipoprotein